MRYRNFRSFTAWSTFAKKHGLKVRKVSTNKTSEYWQSIHKTKGIVGFFNKYGETRGVGHVDTEAVR